MGNLDRILNECDTIKRSGIIIEPHSISERHFHWILQAINKYNNDYFTNNDGTKRCKHGTINWNDTKEYLDKWYKLIVWG